MGSMGQVFADSCLVCSEQCFIQSHPVETKENKLTTASRKKRGVPLPSAIEIRQTLYKAFDVGLNPEDILAPVNGNVVDLPLCGSCVFKVGQLKTIQNQLNLLERQYERLREELAFSIVDIVASNLSNAVCTNIGNQPTNVIRRKLKEFEVGTLQQLVFEKWHESTYTEFDELDQGVASPEHPTSSHQNSISEAGTRTQSRKSSTSSKSGVSSSAAPTEKQSSISITKIESNGTAYENGELQILDVEEEPVDGYGDENSSGSPVLDTDGYMLDDEFEGGDDTQDPLAFPFGLELAEYSTSIRNGGVTYGEENEDDLLQDFNFDDTYANERAGNEPQQNLEVFRDKDGLYECEFCQKKFIHKYPFRDHLRVHFGDGPRCKICNKIFPKKHNLMLHLRTHSGEKPYVCSVCDKGFADKSNLKVHMRVHTGERPYKCEFCNVAFSNSSRLVVHKRTHTGEKPFSCNVCNRKCTTRNQLSTHMKTHLQTGRNRTPKTKLSN